MFVKTQYIAKVCLLGDGAVGKTAIRDRYLGKGFHTSYLMTIGADFAVKTIRIHNGNEDLIIKYSIWDLAGQQRFQAVRESYYEGARGGILVFDITRRETLLSLPRWVEEFFTHNSLAPVPLIILGNKVDLIENDNNTLPYVRKSEVEIIIKTLKEKYPQIPINYLETSAKTGKNINKAFELLTQAILHQ